TQTGKGNSALIARLFCCSFRPLFRAASIKRKLTLLVMLTTTIALLVAAVQFILNDLRDYRRRTVNDLAVLTRIIGENCTSALEFDDARTAAQILSALQAKPSILAAGVYSRNGKLFAPYLAQGQPASSLPDQPPSEGQHLRGMQAALCQPIYKG